MGTFLFDQTIFGPVKSRRLGISLGINLLPNHQKYCSFNCIYCECGWTGNNFAKDVKLPSASEVKQLLKVELIKIKKNSQSIDVITFAGNGEPTLHPEFARIIDDTIELRNQYFPKVKIAVLSNATMIQNPSVFNALNKIEMNVLKIDSGIESTCKILNMPMINYSLHEVIKNLKRFKGKLIIQTLFLRGIYNGQVIDNTTPKEILNWLNILKEVKPLQVMVYTIDRDTAAQSLQKIPLKELKKIALKVKLVGIKALISE
jgi:wyosine [tRNA(Phe)-imidazoG37] synthetase (radical SAM superfamily)